MFDRLAHPIAPCQPSPGRRVFLIHCIVATFQTVRRSHAHRPEFRIAPGETPVKRLNALLKEASDSYPSSDATCDSDM